MLESVFFCFCIIDIMEFLRLWNLNVVDRCCILKIGVLIIEILFKNIYILRKIVRVCFGIRIYEYFKDLEGIFLCI